MKKLLWIALCGTIPFAFGGCVVRVGCESEVDCDSFSYCGVDGFCHDDTDQSIYQYCAVSTDCYAGGQNCTDVTTSAGTSGTFCTNTCTTNAECLPNRSFAGFCMDITDTGGIFLCYQQCADDLDCEAYSICNQVNLTDGTIGFMCMPD